MQRKVIFVLLFLLAVVVCSPVVLLISGSFMGADELRMGLRPVLEGGQGFVDWKGIPLFPTLKNYVELLLDSPEFFTMFWNSVKLTLGILLGQILAGVPAAWGFSRFQFPMKNVLFTMYVMMMMMPFQVTMLSNFLVLDQLHLTNTHMGVILPAVFSTFPIFIMYRFFCGIPKALMESAKIDGAGNFRVFLYIGLPLGSGGIVSATVLGFLEYWNMVEQPLTFLKDKSLWPLSLYLPNIGLEQAGIAFTSSVAALIPAALVFFCGQDYLEQGIVASAVKE